MMVFISNRKLHVSAYSGHHQVLTTLSKADDGRYSPKHVVFCVNKNPTDATVCRYLFTTNLLYMFRVSKHPSSVPIRPRWRGVAVQVVWTVPEAAGTVFNTPDDGCCDTRNMYSDFAVNKYLHTVASVGFLFTLNYDARNHEFKKM